MKKNKSIIGLLLIVSMGISGCGTIAQSDNKANSAANSNRQTGQFTRADLSGEVTSITGSEVVLKLIEIPTRSNNSDGNNGQNQGQSKDLGQDKSQGQAQGQGGNRGPRQDGGQPQQRTVKYTGESKTITIPAEVPITTFERGQNGQNGQSGQNGQNGRVSKKIKFKDIKQGDTLQIWYQDKDKGTISRINVMPGTAGK